MRVLCGDALLDLLFDGVQVLFDGTLHLLSSFARGANHRAGLNPDGERAVCWNLGHHGASPSWTTPRDFGQSETVFIALWL
jgi:hypothetical protein